MSVSVPVQSTCRVMKHKTSLSRQPELSFKIQKADTCIMCIEMMTTRSAVQHAAYVSELSKVSSDRLTFVMRTDFSNFKLASDSVIFITEA